MGSMTNYLDGVTLGTCKSHVNPKAPHLLNPTECEGWQPMDWPVVDVAEIVPAETES